MDTLPMEILQGEIGLQLSIASVAKLRQVCLFFNTTWGLSFWQQRAHYLEQFRDAYGERWDVLSMIDDEPFFATFALRKQSLRAFHNLLKAPLINLGNGRFASPMKQIYCRGYSPNMAWLISRPKRRRSRLIEAEIRIYCWIARFFGLASSTFTLGGSSLGYKRGIIITWNTK